MLKIDIHTHILPPEIPKFREKFGYSGFIQLLERKDCCGADMVSDTGQFFRQVQANCYDPDVRLQECEEAQVRVQVLSTVPVMFSYWAQPRDGNYVAQFLNDHLASVVQRAPKRFVGLGTLPMQDVELSILEAERGIKNLGLAGFQIGSNINGLNLSEKSFFPLYDKLQELGAALFIHPWEMMGEAQMQKYWLPWLVGMPAESARAICSFIFGGVFEKFPRLRVAFAHGGGSFIPTLGRIEHGHLVRPDLCAIDNIKPPSAYLGRFYVDSLVHEVAILKLLVEKLGADRICLGTDYPFPLGENRPGALIQECGFSEDVQEKLLCSSALSWLNLPKSKFL